MLLFLQKGVKKSSLRFQRTDSAKTLNLKDKVKVLYHVLKCWIFVMLTIVSAWYNDLQICAQKPIIMANKVV